MLETNPLSTDESEVQLPQPLVTTQKRSPIARFGCGILLILWFTILLTPCVLFYLAANGEIRIWHGDIPDPHSHPRLLIELISEVDYRGVSVVTSSVFDSQLDDNAMCVQTDVRYFLWETIDINSDVSYCDCYYREDIDSTWALSDTSNGACITNP